MTIELQVSPKARAGSIVWRTASGEGRLTVICKATFRLEPGMLRLADACEPLFEADQHWGNDPGRSVRAPCDWFPFKDAADVVVVGDTFAPRGEPIESLTFGVEVAQLKKSIEIVGDRSVGQGGKPTRPVAFARMSLAYERAPLSADNPVGVDPGATTFGAALPNLVSLVPTTGASSVTGRRLVGVGPVAGAWPGRRGRLSPAAAAWIDGRYAGARPADVNSLFFNVAPHDQQLVRLRGNERIVLKNGHPRFAELDCRLPGVAPSVVLEKRGEREPRKIAMACDTLVLDTARGLATLTFRGQLPLERVTDEGLVVVKLDEPGHTAAASPLGLRGGAPKPVADERTAVVPDSPDALFAGELDDDDDDDFVGTAVLRGAGSPSHGPPWLARGGGPAAWPAPPPVPASELASAPPLANLPTLASLASYASSTPVITSAPSSTTSTTPVVSAPPQPAQVPLPPAPSPVVAGRAANAPGAVDVVDVVDVVWFEPGLDARLREHEAFAKLARPAPDPLDAGAPRTAAARQTVGAVLARAPTWVPDAAGVALVEASLEGGVFSWPLVALEGELLLHFDELEALHAALAVASPHAASEKTLRDAVELARELLASGALASAPSVAEALAAKLGEAFVQAQRALGPGYLREHCERALLAKRAYAKRVVFGAPCLRAAFAPAGSSEPVPAYLPEPIARALPMARVVRARLLAEVHLQQDEFEPNPFALRVVALARPCAFGA